MRKTIRFGQNQSSWRALEIDGQFILHVNMDNWEAIVGTEVQGMTKILWIRGHPVYFGTTLKQLWGEPPESETSLN